MAQLLESKKEIEAEIGEVLHWNPNPENRDKVIALYRDAELSRRDKWPEYLEWMVERTRWFRRAFGPRLKLLNLIPDGPAQAEEPSA